MENWPLRSRLKLPTISPSRGSNATTCAPKTPAPFLVIRPDTLPVVSLNPWSG